MVQSYTSEYSGNIYTPIRTYEETIDGIVYVIEEEEVVTPSGKRFIGRNRGRKHLAPEMIKERDSLLANWAIEVERKLNEKGS